MGSYNPAMRSWLVIVFWVLVPLQLSWAAAHARVTHDTAHASARHCSHSHASAHMHTADAGEGHADCSTCHNGCSMPCPGEAGPSIDGASALSSTGTTWQPASHHARRPDRPQWVARA